jgi:hypothetical protein
LGLGLGLALGLGLDLLVATAAPSCGGRRPPLVLAVGMCPSIWLGDGRDGVGVGVGVGVGFRLDMPLHHCEVLVHAALVLRVAKALVDLR